MTRTIVRTVTIAAPLAFAAGCARTLPQPVPAMPRTDAARTVSAMPADMVLRNGKIFVGDSAGTIVEALAVRGGRVVYAGTRSGLDTLTGPNTAQHDLQGRLVTPGFNDAHIHFAAGGASLLAVDLGGTRSLAEIERRVAAAAARAQPGEWITGRGWDHTRLPASELGPGGWPTNEILNRAAPRNPVLLGRVDGHTSWANREALRIAGVDRATRAPAGGEIVRDAAGEATGILKESAEGLVARVVPDPTPAQVRRGIGAAMEMAARTGVTSVQSDVSAADVEVYRALAAADSLSVRVYGWFPLTERSIRELQARGVTAPTGDEWVRLGMVKGYTDGTLGSRTAAMLEPFADDHSTRGLPQYTEAQLDSLVTAADRAGLQVILHAIGDAANRQALDAFERVARRNPPRAGATASSTRRCWTGATSRASGSWASSRRCSPRTPPATCAGRRRASAASARWRGPTRGAPSSIRARWSSSAPTSPWSRWRRWRGSTPPSPARAARSRGCRRAAGSPSSA
jgi:predicted amidohydrolase YtcJ